MKSTRSRNFIIAVAFAAALIVGAGAEASNLFAVGGDPAPKAAAERQSGLFQQALNWLTDVWTHLASVFAASEPTSPPPGPQGCEDGWGLDPEGCPRP